MSTTNQPVINGQSVSQIVIDSHSAPQLVSGYTKDGSLCWSLPMTDHFELNGTYRMIYEIKNFKGENPYSKNVDLTFSGVEIFESLLKTFDSWMTQYTGPSGDKLFNFQNFCQYGPILYSHVKIKGHTPSVRKQLKSMNPQLTTKLQKSWLRNEGLMDIVRSFFYFTIKKNFNSVHIEDIESMTEEEILQFKDSAIFKDSYEGDFEWEKEINLQKLYKNEEKFWKGRKHGFIKSTAFNSDFSNIKTLVTSSTKRRS